jgi:hypothetical protein
MKATLFFRIAAVVFVLFALGHTFGFLSLKPPTAEAQAVRASMDQVRFEVNGASYSFGEFYLGLGLSITLFLLFSACVAWHLGQLSRIAPRAVRVLGWIFCAMELASTIVAAMYISRVPAIFSGVVALCLALGSWKAGGVSEMPRQSAPSRPHNQPA